jgi:hypothetical protein
MIRWVCLALFVGALVALTGCDGSGTKIDIEGEVKLNGEPVADGDINFIPEDKKFGGEGGKITGGKYKMKARPGKNKVEIRATKEVQGKKVPSAAGPDTFETARESIIPKKYNEETTLTADVSATNKTHNFDLKSP